MKIIFTTLFLFSTAVFSSALEKVDGLFYPEKTPQNTRLLFEDVITYFALGAALDTLPTKAELLPPNRILYNLGFFICSTGPMAPMG